MSGLPPGNERQILPDHRLDDVARAVIVLTRELWAMQDRQIVTEHLLRANGIDLSQIDEFQPDAALQAVLAERRERLLCSVVDAMRGEG